MTTKKTYTITVEEEPNGDISVSRVNEGFNPFELLGIIEDAKSSVLRQISDVRHNLAGADDPAYKSEKDDQEV